MLAIGASQSAGRMIIYYDRVLPQVSPCSTGTPSSSAPRRPESAPSRCSRCCRRPTCAHRSALARQRPVPPVGGRRVGPLRVGRSGVPRPAVGARPRRRPRLPMHQSAVQPGAARPRRDRAPTTICAGGCGGASSLRRRPLSSSTPMAPRCATSSAWPKAGSSCRRSACPLPSTPATTAARRSASCSAPTSRSTRPARRPVPHPHRVHLRRRSCRSAQCSGRLPPCSRCRHQPA